VDVVVNLGHTHLLITGYTPTNPLELRNGPESRGEASALACLKQGTEWKPACGWENGNVYKIGNSPKRAGPQSGLIFSSLLPHYDMLNI